MRKQTKAKGNNQGEIMATSVPETLIAIEDAFESVAKYNAEVPGLLPGVKLLGLRSKNRRNYDTPGVRETGRQLMEGAIVYIDHPSPEQASKPRSYMDDFGHIENVQYKSGEGHYGDLRFNPEHPAAKKFLWDVQHRPKKFGLSINARIRPGKTDGRGDVIVESLEEIRSIDLVTKPGAVNGIFESVTEEDDSMTIDMKTLREKHADLVEQIRKEALESASTTSEIETLRKQHEEAMEQLKEFQRKEEARSLRAEVEKSFMEAFRDTSVPEDLQAEVIECACQMEKESREKFQGIISKFGEMYREVPDEDDTDEGEESEESEGGKGSLKNKKATEQAEDSDEDADETPSRRPAAAGYRPGNKSGRKAVKYSIYESLGIKAD